MRELIVVEGKNDAAVIRRALGDVEVLWTEGFALKAAKVAYIRKAAAERGVIVCTDPDSAGERIRARLDRQIPGLQHIFLPRDLAREARSGDIGWENATPETVRAAFAEVKLPQRDIQVTDGQARSLQVTGQELRDLGLSGSDLAAQRRQAVSRDLGLGECNAKQFLLRLNRFAVTLEELREAVKRAVS